MSLLSLNRVVTFVARLVLAMVFGVSALSKLTAPGLFQAEVGAYHLLPAAIVGPFALALPWIEALLAVYLLIGLFLRPVAAATAVLLAVFTFALAISLAQGNTAHGCGCLPTTGPIGRIPFVAWLSGGSDISIFDIVRDLIFIGLCGIVYWGDAAVLNLGQILFGRAEARIADDWPDRGEPA